MKRILFLLAFVPALICAQDEVKFMGIPICYTYEQLTTELSKKLTKKHVNEIETDFTGTFAGIDECDISVVRNDSGYVDQIIVMKNLWYKSADVPTLKLMYDDKYGNPIDVDNRDKEIVTYTYRMGETMINFMIEFDKYNPSKTIGFDIFYFPRKYRGFSTDDI